MGIAAFGFNFRPPCPAVAKADAIKAERFGNDDVLDACWGEIAFFGEVGDAAKAACFLIRCA